MYNLIGMRDEIIDETFDGFVVDTISKVVASFDNEKDAKNYAEASKLSTYRECASWRVNTTIQFSKKSLLRGFLSYKIEEDTFPPHNPKIDS